MRTKIGPAIKALLIVGALVLIGGCTPNKGVPTGAKCAIDSDCGQGFCSENLQTITNLTCEGGKCFEVSSPCDDSEICIQDSTGVRCEDKEGDINIQLMSCGENTQNTNITGFNQFNTTGYTCSDDCPKDTYCNDACNCVNLVELSCSGNSGNNAFDLRTNICADDCPGATVCNAQCECEMMTRDQCPDPVFTNEYFDPPPVQYDFDVLFTTWRNNPMQLFYLPDPINITAYEHQRDGVFYTIPFPEVQLTRVPNTEYLPQYGAFCVNDYYEGKGAADIDGIWLWEPEQTCIWGPAEGFGGVLTVCLVQLIEWFEEVYDYDSLLLD